MVVYEGVNATGWSELIAGKIVQAPVVMFQASWHHFAIIFLFFVFQMMLFMKTKSPMLCMIITIFFTGTVAFTGIIPGVAMWILYIVTAAQILGTIWYTFWGQ